MGMIKALEAGWPSLDPGGPAI